MWPTLMTSVCVSDVIYLIRHSIEWPHLDATNCFFNERAQRSFFDPNVPNLLRQLTQLMLGCETMNSPSVRLKIMNNSYLLNSTHPHPQHNGKTKQATIPVNRQDAMNEPARVFSSIEATLFFFSLLSLAHTKRRDAIVCNWPVAENRLVCDTLATRCDCRRRSATHCN